MTMTLAAIPNLVCIGIFWPYTYFFHQCLIGIYVLLALAAVPCADAWSLDSKAERTTLKSTEVYGWSRYLCWIVVAVPYFLAGLSKLRASDCVSICNVQSASLSGHAHLGSAVMKLLWDISPMAARIASIMIRKVIVLSLVVLAVAFAADKYPKLNYELDSTWPQLPAGTHLLATASVAVDSDDNVYLFHRGTHPIQVFDRKGRFVREFGKDLFTNAHGLTIDHEGNLWTVDNGSNFIAKMDTTGRVKMILGTRGSAGESDVLFDKPTDCFIAPNGDIYVSDGYGNSRVVKFDKNGKFLTAWGKKGANPGEFNIPHAITLDKDGLVYVADRENYRIQIFNSDGRFLKAWTHVGSPWGLFMTDDALFMSDGYNDRVLKLDLEGKILGSLGGPGSAPGEFRYPHHLAIDSTGALFVAEILNMRAQRFAPVIAPK